MTGHGVYSRRKADFDANLDLWKHEENVRLQRNTVLLSANALLAVGVSALISISPPVKVAALSGLTLALVGFVSCWTWIQLHDRHLEYARFRRAQLRQLAANLGYESWENQWDALGKDGRGSIRFSTTGDEFQPRPNPTGAIRAEGRLPRLFIVLWLAVAVVCAILLALSLLNGVHGQLTCAPVHRCLV